MIPYEKAWEAALNYLRSFPQKVSLDEREFFEKVYLSVRGRFEELLRFVPSRCLLCQRASMRPEGVP